MRKKEAQEDTLNRMIEASRTLTHLGWDGADESTRGVFKFGYIKQHGKSPTDNFLRAKFPTPEQLDKKRYFDSDGHELTFFKGVSQSHNLKSQIQ
jgi:hypothetical protein